LLDALTTFGGAALPTNNGTSNGGPPAQAGRNAGGAAALIGRMMPQALGASPYQLQREYVAGASPGWFYGQTTYATALTHALDDVEADFGDDIYMKMSVDPQISACITVFKAGILEGGLDLTSPISDGEDPDFDLAKNITDEALKMFENLRTPLDDVLWDMCSCIQLGSKVAELVFEIQPGKTENRPMLHLTALKPKPRRATAFVIDAYDNVFGMLVRLPGQASPFLGMNAFDPRDPPINFLPREKFAIATFRQVDGDPRGTSLLRPAYHPWWRKRQIYDEHLRYLAQFAGPSIVGFTPPDAQPVIATDEEGNPLPDQPQITPEMAMLAALQQLRNGTAAAFPGGSAVQPIEMQGNGEAFLSAIDECNVSITKSLLTQELATEEGAHMARAAAQVHQDVLGTLVRHCKRSLLRMVIRDILKPWVIYNWGSKASDLVPVASLGDVEQEDMAPMITALATAGYQIGPSQLPELDTMLNLPKRDAEADQALADAAAQAQAEAAAALAGPPETAGDAPNGGPGAPTESPSDSGASDKQPVGDKASAKSAATMSADTPPPPPDGQARTPGTTPLQPRGRPLRQPPAWVRYTAADLRALARAWDQSMPEYAGLIEATAASATSAPKD
jgi:hypothetical protein